MISHIVEYAADSPVTLTLVPISVYQCPPTCILSDDLKAGVEYLDNSQTDLTMQILKM